MFVLRFMVTVQTIVLVAVIQCGLPGQRGGCPLFVFWAPVAGDIYLFLCPTCVLRNGVYFSPNCEGQSKVIYEKVLCKP